MTADAVAARMRGVVDYVKYYAPKATILLVGYPELHRDGAREACVTVGGAQVRRPVSSGIIEAMRRLQAAQEGAARILGVGFLDAQAVTRGHGLCTPDPWINGVFHPSLNPVYTALIGHPTVKGDAVLAEAVRVRLGL